MPLTHFFIVSLFSAVLCQQHVPCIDYSAVCVPAAAMQRGCHCALIRPGQEEAARESLLQMFGRSKRDTFDDIRFAILSQNGVNELNRFFSAAESAPVGVDNNVFASINTNVHASLMTVNTSMLPDVVNMQGNWLSPESRSQLLNCGGPRCEVVGHATDLMGNSPPTRQDRKFRVARAVRYDIEPDTSLIAFSSAESDFVLNKRLVQWQEKQCKRRFLVFKKCRKEPRSREELREFDDATRANWMNHVNRQMVGTFRVNNANMLA